jgi:phospholipase/carboxylesterase
VRAGGAERAAPARMAYRRASTRLTLSAPDITAVPATGSRGKPLVVLLHGFGKTAAEHSLLPDRINRDDYCYLIPQAPFRSLRDGAVGYGWVVTDYGGDDPYSRGVSEAFLLDLVRRRCAELEADPDRVHLVAFSQAAFVATSLALRHPGVFRKVALQGGWARLAALAAPGAPELGRVDFLLQHGRRDEHVPIAAARELDAFLRRQGARVRLREYECGHEYSREMLDDLDAFLNGAQ